MSIILHVMYIYYFYDIALELQARAARMVLACLPRASEGDGDMESEGGH